MTKRLWGEPLLGASLVACWVTVILAYWAGVSVGLVILGGLWAAAASGMLMWSRRRP